MNFLKVEYNVYTKLVGNKLIKLNFIICEKSKISILMIFKITESLDKYNITIGYYNDTYYKTTS